MSEGMHSMQPAHATTASSRARAAAAAAAPPSAAAPAAGHVIAILHPPLSVLSPFFIPAPTLRTQHNTSNTTAATASSSGMSKEERAPAQQPVLASIVSSSSSSSSPSPPPASASFPSSSSSSLSSSSGSSSPSPSLSSHSRSPRGGRDVQSNPDAARLKHRNNETTRRRQMQKQFHRLRAVTGAGRKEDRVSILNKAAKQLEHCMRAHGGAYAAPAADELQNQHEQQQQAPQQPDATVAHELSGAAPLSLTFGSSGLNAMLPVEQESSSGQQLMMMQPLPHTGNYGCVPMSPSSSSSSSSPGAYLFHTASFLPPSLYSRQSTFVYGLESSSGSAASVASLASSASAVDQRLRSPSPEPYTLQQTSSLSSILTHGGTVSLDHLSNLMKQERAESGLVQQMAVSAAAYEQQTSSSSSIGHSNFTT